MKPVAIVAAIAENGVIGRDNQLIWRLRSDLKRFRAITLGKPLVMGRKTYESIGKPLPGRRTIVMTRDPAFVAQGVVVARSFDAALELADAAADDMAADEIVVAGGAEIYALALPRAQRLRLTLVRASPDGDACFPAYDRAAFREVSREDHPAGADDEHAFSFVDLERREVSGFS
ncbi:MAG: dihydrofolate reductase [Salinarimonadaceae bacterium]|nr:MAG: dihydrofolate reductase [Salinarimonadaceae bacterium]